MASRPRPSRGPPHGFMQHHAKEWLAVRLSPLGPPRLEADHHNRTVDDAGEQVLRRPRDGLNTVRLALRGSGRCVLTPPRARRRSKNACDPRNTLRPRG